MHFPMARMLIPPQRQARAAPVDALMIMVRATGTGTNVASAEFRQIEQVRIGCQWQVALRQVDRLGEQLAIPAQQGRRVLQH